MIKVLFFARLREQLNCEQLDLELANDSLTIADVKQQLVTLHPDWQSYLQDNALLNAVNQQMADNNTSISSGDEVAFFPPVTGG
ncbi:molybdopterin converting factor subunit 1 [Thalassotalea agariperforans]|jgi:molybdopterin synthase sulfur carrier subunit